MADDMDVSDYTFETLIGRKRPSPDSYPEMIEVEDREIKQYRIEKYRPIFPVYESHVARRLIQYPKHIILQVRIEGRCDELDAIQALSLAQNDPKVAVMILDTNRNRNIYELTWRSYTPTQNTQFV